MSETTQSTDDELSELALYRDLETDQLIRERLLAGDTSLSEPLNNELVFKYDELSLQITAGPEYPVLPATYEVDNHALPRTSVIELRSRLREIFEDAGSTNNLARWRAREADDSSGVYEPTMVVLELARETVRHLRAYRIKASSLDGLPTIEPELPIETKRASSNFSSGGLAFQYLPKTPQQICAEIPAHLRVLHMEEVLRGDLTRAFGHRREQLRAVRDRQSMGSLRQHVPPQLQHSRRKEDLVEYLVKPRLTFHGTQRQYVPSIVRHGFLKPGDRDPSTRSAHRVRCGSTYGRGIYSSPSADFSLSYSDRNCHVTKPDQYFGLKLVVCATIMGRASRMFRTDDWHEQEKPYDGADSHVANRELEYIVFDTAQIIPLYVIHLDSGQDNASHFLSLPTNPTHWVKATRNKMHPKREKDTRWPEDIKRAKRAVHDRASKYFPYGYGPATGGRFVVEEVGEIDEDDEEYGDYQAFRGVEIKDSTNSDFWSWVKAADEEAAGDDGLADEYLNERRGYEPASWDRIPALIALEEEADDEVDDEEGDFGLDLLML
ncbi:hypothetical protein BJ170DRAFT_616399 [Xylariales sp. AK1849]|nr:hypothetical protein BJ170DRAFT_616399 [Xylariales sp. AK1849]